MAQDSAIHMARLEGKLVNGLNELFIDGRSQGTPFSTNRVEGETDGIVAAHFKQKES